MMRALQSRRQPVTSARTMLMTDRKMRLAASGLNLLLLGMRSNNHHHNHNYDVIPIFLLNKGTLVCCESL